MTWTITQLGELDAHCVALREHIEALHASGTLALATAAYRAGETLGHADAYLSDAAAFVDGLDKRMSEIASFALPDTAVVKDLVEQQLRAAEQAMALVRNGVAERVVPLTAKATALAQALSTASMDEYVSEAADALDEAVGEIASDAEALIDELSDDVEALGSELFGGVEEAVERIEEISDRVDALLTTAAEVGEAINEGTAEASDALQVAADIVNLTRDCISQL